MSKPTNTHPEVKPRQPLQVSESIGSWSAAELAEFIRKTIQQEPGILPASVSVRTLQVAESLYYKGVLQ